MHESHWLRSTLNRLELRSRCASFKFILLIYLLSHSQSIIRTAFIPQSDFRQFYSEPADLAVFSRDNHVLMGDLGAEGSCLQAKNCFFSRSVGVNHNQHGKISTN